MDEKELNASNFMPEDLLEIICILEKGDLKRHSYKIIRKRNYFSLITKFPAKNGSTPLKNSASAQRAATHQDKQVLSADDKLRKNKRRKRGRNKSSPRASRLPASPHTDKKDSSNVGPAQNLKQKKKKSPAQVARDRARRKNYWKRMKIARQLRAENLAGHNQLQETETVASPQSPVVSQPEKGCLDRTSAVSQSIRHLTIERETVGTARAQLDSNRLSAEAAVEHSSILLENNKDSDVVCARCLKRGNQSELRRCTGCKSFSYCSKDCQISDWPSHKQMCKSIQSLNQQN